MTPTLSRILLLVMKNKAYNNFLLPEGSFYESALNVDAITILLFRLVCAEHTGWSSDFNIISWDLVNGFYP